MILIWAALATALLLPVGLALRSPLLAWRDPVYVAAGLAGIVGLALLLVQPLLAGGRLPGISAFGQRRLHRGLGALLVCAVVVHVAGLWLTSPPDVIDALLFASPTPFSAWGVIAMWAVLASALLAALRRQLRLRPRLWRRAHRLLAAVIVAGTVVHALLIEGTMEPISKVVLCVLAVAAAGRAMIPRPAR
ncbi:ferric reductase-like transmembrane domain-containing protein [Roseisalinus antarcticus]|uniref:Ferric reductase like transmembrane component n=1 Tax=Roseisalinus antarcticus TaxID=254357 RepID=A0A1Y5TBV1_9RHOB|nr:ferric reductase-like transmembrane domain-containing protein [Roseisalinus antarcticus]SLN60109.1 Ferric reductase like transmembrane component [Roseisalinus antarcticus]